MFGDGEYQGEERFECPNGEAGPFFKADGLLMDVEQRLERHLRNRGGGAKCESCGSSLAGGTHYLPYEDGSNTLAYVKCPACGHSNDREGFGE